MSTPAATPKRVRGKRWVAAFDSHGDQCDAAAVKAFHEFCQFWKPDIRIAGGDHFDMRWLRRGAADEEKMESVGADVDAGCDFLARLRPTHFLFGNHDHRLVRALNDGGGAVRELAGQFLDRIGVVLGPDCQKFPYSSKRGVLKLGNHSFVHGYCAGIQAVRDTARVYGNVTMGHLHRIESAVVDRVEETTGYCAGCLCRLDMDYADHTLGILKWRAGWQYGILLPSGENLIYQARKVGSQWVLPTEITTL